MTNHQCKAQIVLIDRQTYWRAFAEEALYSADLYVRPIDNYRDAPALLDEEGARASTLVILGCTSVEVDERLLIQHILERKHHLIVFSVILPTHVMRTLFLKGVDDVVDKVYEAGALINTVEQTLERISNPVYHFLPKERGI